MYSGCPIGWCRKLKTDISLSTAESEYIALYQYLRTGFPLVTLVEELSDTFPLYIKKLDLHCKVFGDNQSFISLTVSSKFFPQTNHIALKYHHFKSYENSKRLIFIYTLSEDRLAEILTNIFQMDNFIYYNWF